jgi:hypothetical protein
VLKPVASLIAQRLALEPQAMGFSNSNLPKVAQLMILQNSEISLLTVPRFFGGQK